MLEQEFSTGGLEKINVPVVKRWRGVRDRGCSHLNVDIEIKKKVSQTVFNVSTR